VTIIAVPSKIRIGLARQKKALIEHAGLTCQPLWR